MAVVSESLFFVFVLSLAASSVPGCGSCRHSAEEKEPSKAASGGRAAVGPPAAHRPPAPVADADTGGKRSPKGYRFTEDWFSGKAEVWLRILDRYRGRPHVKYLELGVFEGRSLLWMLKEILTHPSSRAYALDIFYPDYFKTFLSNLILSGYMKKVVLLQGTTQNKLKELPHDFFDIIYIDASHAADDVLSDAVLSWRLLKRGGIMIFDDYKLGTKDLHYHGSVMPSELRPKEAVDAFISAYRRRLDIILVLPPGKLRKGKYVNHPVVITKKENPCDILPGGYLCSPMGTSHVYFWHKKSLRNIKSGKETVLEKAEAASIEAYLNTRGKGEEIDQSTGDVELMANKSLQRIYSKHGIKNR